MKTTLVSLFWDLVYYSGANALYNALRRNKLALLGYHSVSHERNKVETHNDVYAHLSVSADMFETQMRWLQRNDYTFLRFSDLRDIRQGKRALPPHSALVYFDDGYKDVYLNAYPILKQLGISATIFVATDCIDKKKILWETVLNPAEANIFLSWEELRRMKDVFDIGSHTVTHRKLTELQPDEIQEECAQSRQRITEMTNTKPIAFSYPKSRWTPDVRRIAAEAGFEFILAHGKGFRHNADLRYLEKIPVGPEDSLRVFVLKLGIYYPLISFVRWISHS